LRNVVYQAFQGGTGGAFEPELELELGGAELEDGGEVAFCVTKGGFELELELGGAEQDDSGATFRERGAKSILEVQLELELELGGAEQDDCGDVAFRDKNGRFELELGGAERGICGDVCLPKPAEEEMEAAVDKALGSGVMTEKG